MSNNFKSVIDVTSACTNFNEGSGVLANYLKDVRKYEVLSQEEERLIFTRIKNGDSDAIDELVKANQRFVFAVAKKYANSQNLMDLVEEGNLGMLEAIEKYDMNMTTPTGEPVRFLSFAVWYIRRQISSFIINDETLVKKTNNTKTAYKLNKIKNNFFLTNGRYPSMEEIKSILEDEYGITIKEDAYLYDVETCFLDNTFNSNEKNNTFENSQVFNEYSSIRNDFEQEIEDEDNTNKVEILLSTLTERERVIVKKLFGIGEESPSTIEALSEETNLTKERIRQIKNSCLEKLKKVYAAVN